MQILSFRIQNFRSIVDSGWCHLSRDKITAFVGQNESGKSSILYALHSALSDAEISYDDIRVDAELPSVDLRVKLDFTEIAGRFEEIDLSLRQIVEDFCGSKGGILELRVLWRLTSKPQHYAREISFVSDELDRLLTSPTVAKFMVALAEVLQEQNAKSDGTKLAKQRPKTKVTARLVANFIWNELPLGVFFQERVGELPNAVDISDDGSLNGFGAEAAAFFLKIAKLDLQEVLKKEKRAQQAALKAANARVTADFVTFWSQTVGGVGKISISIDIDYHSQDTPQKAGRPYLVFWVIDGATQLYPKQRSQGVRWFISFYLQLKAAQVDGLDRIFLLDEPGANLHSRAQKDVLKMINRLSDSNSSVVYTTHSPDLIEYSRLYRVHAVQRNGDAHDSPTTIIDAHKLGTATTDTLSPVLTAMGSDLSQQQVIKKKNNVLLEEMSGFYYLSAFWALTEQSKQAHFIATTGVNKIEALANMFRGWGLDFIVVIDDDKQGREAYKSMKLQLFGDSDQLASERLLKLPGCPAIEDIFSNADFSKHILNDESASIQTTNGEFLKGAGRSKPILAFSFSTKVSRGELVFLDLDAHSRAKILAVTTAIAERLEAE